MLDQNTDRMWFVIGAVIVGAAIIFIANGTIPSIFASVTETFEEQTNQTTGFIDKQSSNLMVPYAATKGYMLEIGTGGLSSSGEHSPRHAVADYMRVEGEVSYTFIIPGHKHTTRLLYYNADKELLTSHSLYSVSEVTLVAPEEAVYARVSGRILDTGSVPLSEWWFGKTEDAPNY